MYVKDSKEVIADRREMLRVKLKSLAEEAKIIRKEEKRSFGVLRTELYLHRIQVVRAEARHTHLAYGFIRGHIWGEMEDVWHCQTLPNWERVAAMCKKYGPAKFVVTPEMKSQARPVPVSFEKVAA